MLKLIYKTFKKQFLQFAFHDQEFKNKPDAELTFQFIDSQGRKYYTYPDALKLPLKRKDMLDLFYQEMDNAFDPNVSRKMFKLIKALAIEEVNEPKKRGINSAKISLLCDEVEARDGKLLREEIFFKIFAVWYIREDENAFEWDEEFQNRKIEQLKQDAAGGLYDFFYKKPAVAHLPFANISSEELESFFRESAMELKSLEMLKNMLTTGEPLSQQ